MSTKHKFIYRRYEIGSKKRKSEILMIRKTLQISLRKIKWQGEVQDNSNFVNMPSLPQEICKFDLRLLRGFGQRKRTNMSSPQHTHTDFTYAYFAILSVTSCEILFERQQT